MKKVIFLLCFLLVLEANAQNYHMYCANTKAHKTISGNLISLTGINTLLRNVIENQIEHAIKRELNADFTVKMNNFYGTNIFNGEFRYLSAKGKKLYHHNIYMSDIFVETICPYNHIEYKDNQILFDENMILKYQAKITQEDLNKTIQTSNFKKIINKMNNDEHISSLIKIQDADVLIQDNHLIFEYEISPLPKYNLFSFTSSYVKPFKVKFSANLRVVDGKIEICDFKLNNKSSKYNILLPILNKLNPTTWKIKLDKASDGKLFVNTVKIENSEIIFNGNILINKNN